ncbi:sulfite exporter TauE/SafE family protein [Desulfoluna spongiiphila]|uniref:sulfite exporter TauE/SafE family protein n=1 Tax=Desulfoluna spongiiphila TaxID=419481 RepID=UPI00125A778D|nr:sulfite exporter TauE/SafE family protein [Desulfoluna spongiiphila]VVS91397.1 transmembrane protein taue-like [Desulfoluna spongiiphila]
MLLITVAGLAFGLSFFFALGGVGSAVALVPALMAVGVPAGAARPVALLVNVASLGGATVHNLRSGQLKPGPWWPLIACSLPAAPMGAWLSSQIPQLILQGLFACFMILSGLVIIRPTGQSPETTRDACPPVESALLGSVSGLISGMLGVGGGGVIVPALHGMGFRAQQIAMVTALAVPFSSLTGFMAYTAMGSLSLETCAAASVSALAGGMLGTRAMHRIDQRRIRMILALSLMASGLRMLWKLAG